PAAGDGDHRLPGAGLPRPLLVQPPGERTAVAVHLLPGDVESLLVRQLLVQRDPPPPSRPPSIRGRRPRRLIRSGRPGGASGRLAGRRRGGSEPCARGAARRLPGALCWRRTESNGGADARQRDRGGRVPPSEGDRAPASLAFLLDDPSRQPPPSEGRGEGRRAP